MSDNNRVYNVLIVGVGGQGIILASDVLGRVAAAYGYDVKKNEIHGMAQRGGSVSSHVRFGKTVSSPIIRVGEADVLLSFEQLETVRYFPFLSEKGKVILNDQKILPPAVFTGKQEYPSDVIQKIKAKVPDMVVVDGISVAERLGNPRVVNVIFLGVLSKYLDIPVEVYEKVLRESLKPKLVDINLKAFHEGRSLAS
ncbi:indolepyruvate oxidoreductase subunit beta [Desulfomonile tiedjei]|uniref:2-oxoacid:ferredoxin oxidoreductase, gamma subunit n=1 Tax=Desulfomonile tiedjei (strain ATCC 49306 / DSM 6799 / DCB-1) TaxID=706587 RepID=I4C8Q5_DESTA|nr:indolepyruvate oxidoreductase subunit beta [Desulfomonile tiedjei]AFM25946.1 2-oxoacid:ferredoxin oxidoreductase, gamma subunit [Desulfomonile tiedjei DSM 6799]